MATKRTNKYAILRDLCSTQVCKAPSGPKDSIDVWQKPPISMKEGKNEVINTIEKMCTADKRDIEIVVEISKHDSVREEIVPQIGAGAKNKEPRNKVIDIQKDTNMESIVKENHVETRQEVKLPMKSKEKNVILLKKDVSFLTHTPRRDENISSAFQTSKNKPEESNNVHQLRSKVNILKPKYFLIDTKIIETVERVNEWLQKPTKPQLKKIKSSNDFPKNIFEKKKTVLLSLELTRMFKRKNKTSLITNSDIDIEPRQSDRVFVPSIHASVFYKKFVEQHRVQEAREDIWKRAERLMKEKDLKILTTKNLQHCITERKTQT